MIFDLSAKKGCDPIPIDLRDLEDEPPPLPDISLNRLESLSSIRTSNSHSSSPVMDDQKSCSGDIMWHLDKAKKHAQMRQFWLRVPTVGGAIILSMLCMSLVVVESSQISFAVGACLLPVALCCGLLGVLPSDKRAVPGIALFSIFIAGCVSLLHVSYAWKYWNMLQDDRCIYQDKGLPCWNLGVLLVLAIFDLINTFLVITRVSCSMRRGSSEILLPTLWSSGGVCLLFLGLTAFARMILQIIAGIEVSKWVPMLFIGVFWSSLGLSMMFSVDLRRSVQSWFMSRAGAAVRAAGVSELLGGQNVKEILNNARSSFFAVRGDRILKEHMKDNVPNPALRACAAKHRLGFVDAFVSHSWHDDADLKWHAFQELRNDFKATSSREPTCWIDKYSINQNSIDESLACLPVYLAGCAELWILCGSSYLTRLWCIIEIYVYLEMGGDISNLRVKVIGDCGKEIRNFNARDAKCFLEADSERLHKVMEVTGYHKIHQLVDTVFLTPQM